MDSDNIPPPILEKLRRAFHDAVTPKLEPDPMFAGPGHVYAFEADLDETINNAVRLAVGEEDPYFEDLAAFDVFTRLADGTDHSLISFETLDGWGYGWGYGIDSAQVLDRGYLYLPGNSEVAWSFIGAWEPAASREAFEHAFITNYARRATDYPPFEPRDPGYADVEVTMTVVNVPPQLLVKAISTFLETSPGAWSTVWTAIKASSLPLSQRVARIMATPEATANAAIKAINDEDQVFRETVAEASDEDRRAVLSVYLHAIGVLPDEANRRVNPQPGSIDQIQ